MGASKGAWRVRPWVCTRSTVGTGVRQFGFILPCKVLGGGSDSGSRDMMSCLISAFKPPQKIGRSCSSDQLGAQHDNFVNANM